jgi:uncharacterized protein YqfA (UPF0365 family)
MGPSKLLILWTTFLTVGIVILLGVLFAFAVFRPWLRVLLSGGKVSIFDILGMRLRGNPPSLLIDAYLALLMSNQDMSIAKVERVYIANKSRILFADDIVRFVIESEKESVGRPRV